MGITPGKPATRAFIFLASWGEAFSTFLAGVCNLDPCNNARPRLTWKLAWNSRQLRLYCILRNNKIYNHQQIWLEASVKKVD